ncbi:hypothetical protein ACSVIJ_22350, partial [Pseudomonas sp. NCHU5208]
MFAAEAAAAFLKDSSRNLGKASFDTGLASLCVVFGVQAAYRRLADVSRFAPRRPSFVKRHKRRQKGL